MKSLASIFLVLLAASAFLLILSAAAEYTLDIFGNANMDDRIDESDIAYVEDVINGTRISTDLSDANYDGKIDTNDIDQIENIIRGDENELTVFMHTRSSMGSSDIIKVPVTIQEPIERIVVTSPYSLSVLRSLGVDTDRVVGIPQIGKEASAYFSEFSSHPSIGGGSEVDYEAILSLDPDLVVVFTSSFKDASEKLPGVTVAALDFWRPSTYVDETRTLGYILDKKDEAEAFIDFYDGVVGTIKERVDKIPEDDRPKVYFESEQPYATCANGSGWHEKVTMAGGSNIFGDLSGYPK
jgi:iron complex transport system substrate-binding protein